MWVQPGMMNHRPWPSFDGMMRYASMAMGRDFGAGINGSDEEGDKEAAFQQERHGDCDVHE